MHLQPEIGRDDGGELVLAPEDVREIAKPAFTDSPFAHHASLDPWWIEGLRCDLRLSEHAVEGGRRRLSGDLRRPRDELGRGSGACFEGIARRAGRPSGRRPGAGLALAQTG
jgi:hypothetical protein